MANCRARIEVEGIVQGVGFRPFIYRLANRYSLAGWVMNTPSGVVIEVEGEQKEVDAFTHAIAEQSPPLAVISSLRVVQKAPSFEKNFVIRESGGAGTDVQIAPDCDVCPDCLRELFDPGDRRYRYPFINCTNCGPRYTIIREVPYDRSRTTMSSFPMCPECRAEYEDPSHRRFHAQPTACPECGPSLRLQTPSGHAVPGDALQAAVALLKEGAILAVKGLGGYHLAVDACNGNAVRELRTRKKRDEKPFALMSPDLAAVAGYAAFDENERRLLTGPERPIVLLRKLPSAPISPLVAPVNGYFGVMLPYTPLHHLLLRDNFTALVMTSGNICDEPVCHEDADALQRLAHLAGFFLTHNRDIHTRVDDSVIRVFRGSPIFLRRSRGYAPRPIRVPGIKTGVLAVGAELKGAVCLAKGERAFLSQHIGDLKNAATLRSLDEAVRHLERALKIAPDVVAHDLHPDYLSTRYALNRNDPVKVAVQHHHAHMASCMAENGVEGEVIGVVLDGSGYGLDGTVWGGEFLVGGYAGFERMAHFRTVPLPGGDAAVREPYRMALSYLYDLFGDGIFGMDLPCVKEIAGADRNIFLKMMQRRINAPLTSSCGRLFDAVAALTGLRQKVSYEGQAAIELEGLAEQGRSRGAYPFAVTRDAGRLMVDFSGTIRAILEEMSSGTCLPDISRSFHDTLGAAIVATCRLLRQETALDRVVLSGGVFQNKLLSEAVVSHLAASGFHVFTHRLAPPNDGGIPLGQAVVGGLYVT